MEKFFFLVCYSSCAVISLLASDSFYKFSILVCDFRTSTAELKKMSFKETEFFCSLFPCDGFIYSNIVNSKGTVLFSDSFMCSYILCYSMLGLKYFTFSLRKQRSQFAQPQCVFHHEMHVDLVCTPKRNVHSQYFTCVDQFAGWVVYSVSVTA